MRVSEEFTTNQYSSEEELREEEFRFRVKTAFTLDSEEHLFEIRTQEFHPSEATPTESFGGSLIFSDWSDLTDVADLIQRYLRTQDERNRSISVPLESGTGFNSRLGEHIDGLEEATFTVDDDQLEVQANGLRGRLLHYTTSVDFEQLDRRNAVGFLDLVDELLQNPDEEPILHLEHPDLQSDAVPEYVDGHYQSSVRTAFRVLEERIREEGGFSQDMVGMNLAQEAFSPNGGPLTFANVDAEQKG